MNKFDISGARFKHLNWKFRVRLFLDGSELMTKEQAIDHTQCDLGIWYYSYGKEIYGNLSEMQDFEKEHIKLHKIVKQIVVLKEEGNVQKAEEKYIELLNISDRIIYLLNVIESLITKI